MAIMHCLGSYQLHENFNGCQDILHCLIFTDQYVMHIIASYPGLNSHFSRATLKNMPGRPWVYTRLMQGVVDGGYSVYAYFRLAHLIMHQ